MAFFEPVNQATQRKRPSPSSILTTLMADFEAVLVMSLARPEMPCATHNPDNRKEKAQMSGQDTKETSSPVSALLSRVAAFLGCRKRVASQPPPRLAIIPATSYIRNSSAKVNGEYPSLKK